MRLADEITYELLTWAKIGAYDIVIPNFYLDRYEADVVAIKQSGYVYEYEIKVSVSDLLRDFDKGGGTFFSGIQLMKKHERLRVGKHIPNRFFFVIPKDLDIDYSLIPKHCGIITYGRWFEMVRNAPLLHKNRFEDYKGIAYKLSNREDFIRRKYKYLKRIHDELLSEIKKEK